LQSQPKRAAAEALATLAVAKPLLVIGGLGGASRDVASVLGLIDDAELLRQETDEQQAGC
jgi:hypothetical protein